MSSKPDEGHEMIHTICICCDPEHTVSWNLIQWDKDDPSDCELGFTVHLNSSIVRSNFPSWLPGFLHALHWYVMVVVERIWRATKYVFGYKSKYGDFDCFDIHECEVDKLIEYLQKFKKMKNSKSLEVECSECSACNKDKKQEGTK